MGFGAGQTTQGTNAVAMGFGAGQTTQGTNAVTMGFGAGLDAQGQNAVAMGFAAGLDAQGQNAVAMGFAAGLDAQGTNAVAMGNAAGLDTQGQNAVAIGYLAGNSSQGTNALAMGNAAGNSNQGNSAVAIGNYAGFTGQGKNAIALGYYSGRYYQPPYSIVFNASSSKDVNAGGTGFFVKPLRNVNVSGIATVVHYNDYSGELTYGVDASDYRIKENVRSLDDTFRVDYLNPVTYINKQTNKQEIGLIAHELQEYYPELVDGVKDGPELQGVHYTGLIPILINEIKNLKNKNKNDNDMLINIIQKLEFRIAQLEK